MFADPQSVTYSAVAKTLPAISRNDSSSVYQLNDAGVVYNLILTHQFGKRNRAIARLRRDSYSADPIIPAQNLLSSMTATLTVDFPIFGLLPTDAQALVKAVNTWASDANVLKLVNGET